MTVTQRDIDAGEPGDLSYCALAVAARRAFGVRFVVVEPTDDDRHVEITVGGQHNRLTVWMDPIAYRWMRAFDQPERAVKPRRFELHYR